MCGAGGKLSDQLPTAKAQSVSQAKFFMLSADLPDNG